MEIICGVYRIINTITGDFYIGSSKNVKHRLANHKVPSTWNEHPNNPMYQDMKKYGLDKFEFEILEEVEIKQLKEMEQHYIELLKPTYNNYRANGLDIERCKESLRKASKKYYSQLCFYNGETLTLNAVSKRFRRHGIDHPTQEAKKYLL